MNAGQEVHAISKKRYKAAILHRRRATNQKIWHRKIGTRQCMYILFWGACFILDQLVTRYKQNKTMHALFLNRFSAVSGFFGWDGMGWAGCSLGCGVGLV